MKRPLAPIAVSFCLGLTAAHHFQASAIVLLICLGAAAGFVAVLFYTRKTAAPATAIALTLFFCLGFLALQPYAGFRPGPSHVARFAGSGRVQLEGLVQRVRRFSHGRARVLLSAARIHRREASFAVAGKVQVSIKHLNKAIRYGDRIRFFCSLRRPRNYENPGSFDYVRYLAYRMIFVTAFLSDGEGIVKLRSGEGSRLLNAVEDFRDRVRSVIEGTLTPCGQGVLKALVLGERESLKESVVEQFAVLGISHLLAISGLHIGIITFVAYLFFMSLLRLDYRMLLYVDARKVSAVLAVVPVVIYCFIAGFHLPTLRAFCMIVVCLAAMILGRREDLLHTLSLAALAVLVVLPTSLFDRSFQLSFAAALALILTAPGIRGLPGGGPVAAGRRQRLFSAAFRLMAGCAAASATAIMGTAPLVALGFHRFSFAGFLTNVVMVPLVGFLIVPLGLLATVTLPLCELPARLLFSAAGVLVEELLILTESWSRFGSGLVISVTPAWWEVLIYYCVLIGAAICLKRGRGRLAMAGIIGFLVIELAVVSGGPGRGDGRLHVTFIDVGRGDAALVEFPEGSTMIIDGGGSLEPGFDMGRAVLAPLLYHQGIKTVDYLVLSHPHQDHAGGLAYLVKPFSVRELWHNGARSGLLAYRTLRQSVQKSGIREKRCSRDAGPVMIEGVRIDFLSPAENESVLNSTQYNDTNNASLVMKITFGKVGFLFTGDIQAQREAQLAAGKLPLEAAVLKVPHHGKRGSSLPEFVQRVMPRTAVVSGRPAGNASSPAESVLGAYRRVGARIYRTDVHGAVRVSTDGRQYRVFPYRMPNSQ